MVIALLEREKRWTERGRWRKGRPVSRPREEGEGIGIEDGDERLWLR